MTTEQKHEIEIPGLPEGWRAVAYRRLKNGDFYLNEQCEIVENYALKIFALIVEKIKPRRIVLEDTGEVRQGVCGEWFYKYGTFTLIPEGETTGRVEIWREINVDDSTFSEEE